MKRIVIVVLLAFVVGALLAVLRAQSQSVWDGVYSEEQAKRGAALYDKECGGCHGPAGAGGSMAPALMGITFSSNYDGQTLGDLFDRNRVTMPPGKEGQLSLEVNADILAYILQCNKFPSGAKDLPTQSMTLKAIQFLAQKP